MQPVFSPTWQVTGQRLGLFVNLRGREMADNDHNRKDGGKNIIFRSFVLDRMVRAINRWDISSSRNINYRSFAPIIRWHRSWNYWNSVTQGYNPHYHIRHSIITHPEEHPNQPHNIFVPGLWGRGIQQNANFGRCGHLQILPRFVRSSIHLDWYPFPFLSLPLPILDLSFHAMAFAQYGHWPITWMTDVYSPCPLLCLQLSLSQQPSLSLSYNHHFHFLVHQVSPDKYCQLVEDEGGLALVEEIVNNNRWKYTRWRYVGR